LRSRKDDTDRDADEGDHLILARLRKVVPDEEEGHRKRTDGRQDDPREVGEREAFAPEMDDA